MPPQPPELMVELVEEVLLRFPPDDPASLARAALVCKLWRRLVSGAAFRRRFREFHRSRAPLLGVVKPAVPVSSAACFVPTTSFHPAAAGAGAGDGDRSAGWRAMDARHGRVLLYRSYPWPRRPAFAVWDPITGEQRDLPELPFDTPRHRYSAAVACAAATGGGHCNHLECHRAHFVVVVVGIHPRVMSFSVYSSETGAWSQRADHFEPTTVIGASPRAPSVLAGTAFHFLFHTENDEIVKCDVASREASKIRLPSRFHHLLKQGRIVLMTDDGGGGGLGFVASTLEYELELWSMVDGGGGDAGFVLRRVIDLVRLLPCRALIDSPPQVSGFAGVGASRLLFLRTRDGLYSLEINSSQVKKVANCCDNDTAVLPYVSFCTPTSGVKAQEN